MKSIIITIILLSVTGCTTTVGPYITHAVQTPEGLKMRKCERSVSVFLGIVGGKEKNCEYIVVPEENSEE